MLAKIASMLANKKMGVGHHGVACTFFHLDDKYGVKMYRCEATRNYCYENQQDALKFDLAPRLGDKIDAIKVGNWLTYGFITEKAKVAAEYACEHLGLDMYAYHDLLDDGRLNDVYSLIGSYGDYDFSFSPVLNKAWVELWEIIDGNLKKWPEGSKENNLFRNLRSDMHAWNWGIANGRPIIVDFSFG